MSKKENCAICGLPAEDPTKDHWFPMSRGGAKGSSNVVTACKACNNAKDDMLPIEFDYYLRTGRFHPDYVQHLARRHLKRVPARLRRLMPDQPE